jgi:hypothetical protein
MREFGPGPVQGFLGDLAISYVLKSADEQRSADDMFDDTSHSSNVLHGASGRHEPERKIDVSARHGARDHVVERRQVVWVDHIPNHLHRDLGSRIELEDPESLLGPVVVICDQIRDEATRFA